MGEITVVGLGPGRFGLITMETWEILCGASCLLLRTSVHPTVEPLRRKGLVFDSYDRFYEEAEDFSSLYEHIVADLLARAQRGDRVVYAVPGSPSVAERTVVLLRDKAKEAGISLRILAGMSFLEVLYARLGVDPIEGIAVLDAMDVDRIPACRGVSLVLTQVYEQRIASDAKIMLLEMFPDEHEVMYVRHLALPDESVRRIPLFEMDRQPDMDHLTSVFVPHL